MPRRKQEAEPTGIVDSLKSVASESKKKKFMQGLRSLPLSSQIRLALAAPDEKDPTQRMYRTDEEVADALGITIIDIKVERRRFVDELLYPGYNMRTTAPIRSDLAAIRAFYPERAIDPAEIASLVRRDPTTPLLSHHPEITETTTEQNEDNPGVLKTPPYDMGPFWENWRAAESERGGHDYLGERAPKAAGFVSNNPLVDWNSPISRNRRN